MQVHTRIPIVSGTTYTYNGRMTVASIEVVIMCEIESTVSSPCVYTRHALHGTAQDVICDVVNDESDDSS